MPFRRGPMVLLAFVLVTAGCVGMPSIGETPTPLPPGSIEFPDGPKEPPERPADLTAESVRQYVVTFEYRYVYNQLWLNQYTEVTLECRVDDLTERSWGYEVVVTCTGHSNTRPPENATATPGPHYDYFTQSYRYRVSETATRRSEAENRDPVG